MSMHALETVSQIERDKTAKVPGFPVFYSRVSDFVRCCERKGGDHHA